MSTILDALKKSERERTVLRGLGFSDAGWRPARDIDWLRWAVVGGIAAIVLAVLAVILLRTGVVSIKSPVGPLPESKAPVAASVNPSVIEDSLADAANTLPEPVESSAPTFAPSAAAEFLSAMSPEFQKTVPPMTVNIHVYAQEESGRILYINNRSYRRGDEIPGGVRVEEIIPEGVVLQFQKQRFKLARPS